MTEKQMKQTCVKVVGGNYDRSYRGESFNRLSKLLDEGYIVNRVDSLGNDSLIYILDEPCETSPS